MSESGAKSECPACKKTFFHRSSMLRHLRSSKCGFENPNEALTGRENSKTRPCLEAVNCSSKSPNMDRPLPNEMLKSASEVIGDYRAGRPHKSTTSVDLHQVQTVQSGTISYQEKEEKGWNFTLSQTRKLNIKLVSDLSN